LRRNLKMLDAMQRQDSAVEIREQIAYYHAVMMNFSYARHILQQLEDEGSGTLVNKVIASHSDFHYWESRRPSINEMAQYYRNMRQGMLDAPSLPVMECSERCLFASMMRFDWLQREHPQDRRGYNEIVLELFKLINVSVKSLEVYHDTSEKRVFIKALEPLLFVEDDTYPDDVKTMKKGVFSYLQTQELVLELSDPYDLRRLHECHVKRLDLRNCCLTDLEQMIYLPNLQELIVPSSWLSESQIREKIQSSLNFTVTFQE